MVPEHPTASHGQGLGGHATGACSSWGEFVKCSARPLMKSAKNTMLAQNMLAMSGSQGDLPWALESLQTPYMSAALPLTKIR